MKKFWKMFFIISVILALFVVCLIIAPYHTDKLQYFFDGFSSTEFLL